MLNLGKLSWWLYKGKVYLTQGHPRPTEVASFLSGRAIVADLFKQPMFPEDVAFEFKTIGKRKPPRVPIAEVIEPERVKARPSRKRRPRKRVRREHIPVSVNRLVWRRDQGRCVNCGSNERLEYDHIIPVSKGGSNTARNLQLLCERCNRRKGAGIV